MDKARNEESVIYLEKSTLIARLAIGIMLAAMLTYVIAVSKHDFSIGYLITVAFALYAYFIIVKHVYLLIAHKPQIIINAMGIRLPPFELDSWNKIERIKFEKVQATRAINILFKYTVLAKDGTTIQREINISYLDINNKIQMEGLLNNYRRQFYVHNKQEIVPLPDIDHSEE